MINILLSIITIAVFVKKCESFSVMNRLSGRVDTFQYSASPAQCGSSPLSQRSAEAKSVRNIASGAFLAYFVGVKSANAGLFQSAEQDAVDEIAKLRLPVRDLLLQLSPQMLPNAVGVFSETQVLKGSKEDSNVVASYSETYIKPLQQKMKKLATVIKLDDAKSQERLEILPGLMIGHIYELAQAITDQKVTDQKREVEEVVETLNEYLSLVSSKYKVDPLASVRPLSDAELFGPLGCEFWGKKRVKGSNQCTD
mmetsp:Transcript_35589/g.36293  ORF Transcript_35589/g.36293 Transcript_35589/m.36293 type:complete len:254 (+) Transcript_35589:171-932(+)|eukprot:CAMPEP_0182428756 /NCGR_PEP_ID=MMETSP1167-20130531/23367_1 /TAXON_ID=2988 /ORGANISM="Mallomonas Sp, Strain CCMP3275" /LENGTH=253 /DNA_ID=CAMNT_0024611823 /DNA_START=149 /DNA_END=910 /DNA_ORIENTATION=+